jgi:hypothetical protein
MLVVNRLEAPRGPVVGLRLEALPEGWPLGCIGVPAAPFPGPSLLIKPIGFDVLGA